MKTIKSALLGNCTLTEIGKNTLAPRVRQILQEHRAAIITRILSDIPTYVDYKFNLKPTPAIIALVRDLLVPLKNQTVDLAAYNAILEMVQTRAVTHLTNEPFYKEIDEFLRPHLIKSQVKTPA